MCISSAEGAAVKPPNAKKQQGDQTRARILEAATKLFVSRGFAGTPISAIAASVGLTKGALYAHFASKDDLLLSLIGHWQTEFYDALFARVLSTAGDAWAKMTSLVNFHSEFAVKNQYLCLLLITLSPELQGTDHEIGRQLRRIADTNIRFLKRLIEEGQGQGVFDAALDTQSLAHVVVALLNGVLLEWNRTGETLGGPELVRTFRRVLFHGLQPGTAGNRK